MGSNLGSGEPLGLIETIPVLLTIEDDHSAHVHSRSDWDARTRRILEAYTSHLLEHELWTGELATQDGSPAHGGAETHRTQTAGLTVRDASAVVLKAVAVRHAVRAEDLASRAANVAMPVGGLPSRQVLEDWRAVMVLTP